MSAWRSSLAIVTLRYLFLGLQNPETLSHLSHSLTATSIGLEAAQVNAYEMSDKMLHSINETIATYRPEENMEGYIETDHLSPRPYVVNTFSRTPSPLLSPTDETVTFDHWHRRYEIHNEATSELFNSLSALASSGDPIFLRHVLLPLMVLALVSRPSSSERVLCSGLFDRYETFMQHHSAAPHPIGGQKLTFDIPWDRLDAYSAEIEQERRNSLVYVEPPLHNSVCEWNWWFMLKRIDLKSVCE